MKNILKIAFSFYLLLSSFYLHSQVPQKFNYQGIARDAKGNPMARQLMTLKLIVLPTSDATEGEYEEIQSVTTNEFGLYNLQIGNGTALKGEMKTVKWETGNKYIKVMIDPAGGNDFVDAGTTQLLSVPYAIYADKAGMAKTSNGDRTGTVSSNATHAVGDTNFLSKFTGFNTIGKSQLYDNGSSVGLGTTLPQARLHVNANTTGVENHIRMQNTNANGAGRFTMYNNVEIAHSTFTKYGTTFPGGNPGISALYPFANLLAFGNNGLSAGDGNGRFLISSGGNIGISIFKPGASKLKFHADFTTENVGIGGNSAPVSRVHMNNTDGTTMDVRLSNNTSGHTATDGLVLMENGNTGSLINRENGFLLLGTNNLDRLAINGAGNVGIGTISPSAKLDINGQVKISGGSPASGKVLTSDSSGLATWRFPGTNVRNGLSVINDSVQWGGRLSLPTQISQYGQIIKFTDTTGSTSLSISQLASTTLSALSASARTQTFTAPITSFIHSVDLKLTGVANTTVTMELRNASGSVLGSSAITFPALFDTLATFTLPKQLLLSGQVYTLSVTGSTGSNWYLNGTDTLSGGQASTSQSEDFAFRIRTMDENAMVSFKQGEIQASSLTGGTRQMVFADSTGTLLVGQDPPPALPTTTVQSGQAIPDASCTGLQSTISISGAATSIPSSTIKVTLDISHTFVGDLAIFLIAPNNDTLLLCDGNGGTGENFSGTIFSDNSQISITTITSLGAPFAGAFRPNGSLTLDQCGKKGTVATFGTLGGGNINPNGTWTLFVRDDAVADVGTLNSWSISTESLWDNFYPKWNAGVLTTNSLIYERNSMIGINNLSPQARLHVTDGLLISGTLNIGDTVIPKGSGSRMFFNSRKAAFRTGFVSAGQWDNGNIGTGSTAMGNGTIASGTSSTAMGNGTIASGISSTAMGNGTTASGFSSTSIGSGTTAKGSASTAIGNGTTANGFASLVIGQFNDTLVATQTSMQATTPLFIIGNGSSSVLRNNVLIVRNDGKVGIGTDFPGGTLHVAGDLRIGSQETLADSGASLLALANASFIPSIDGTRTLGNSSHRWSSVFAANGTINTSDARDKTNITPIAYGLSALMQLKPVYFNWKNQPEAGRKMGFLAQDLKTIIPEVVADKEFVVTDETTGAGEWRTMNRLGVFYSDLIPVLTKAIQEQQSQIQTQQNQIDILLQQNELQQKQNQQLLKRLEALENK